MKERTRNGRFRCTESVKYKQNKHHGFDQVSWLAFQEMATEKYDFKSGGCPNGFRSTGYQTIAGQRREVCCSSDGKTCMTADGIPL